MTQATARAVEVTQVTKSGDSGKIVYFGPLRPIVEFSVDQCVTQATARAAEVTQVTKSADSGKQ